MFGGLLELIALLVVIVLAGFAIGYRYYRGGRRRAPPVVVDGDRAGTHPPR